MVGQGSDANKLQVEIVAVLKEAKVDNKVIEQVKDAVAQGGTDGVKEVVKQLSTNKEFFSKLFPQLGLEAGFDGNFTKESKLGAGSKILGGAADGLVKMFKTGLGILEDIYKRLEKSSPLLQAVETLFDLAMKLFFMPLGNKLAEEFIPAALEMIDDVMDMWESMEGMTLSEILDETLSKFTTIFLGFLSNIADRLEKHGGLLGAIGKMLNAIVVFADRVLPALINISVNVFSFVFEHFPELIATIVAFKVASTALQIAQIAASTSHGILSGIIGIGGTVLGIGLGALVAGAMTSYAEGGYEPATPGGKLVRVSESGEGEWIVPDSKVSDFVSNQSSSRNLNVSNIGSTRGDNYTINVYGYTDSELKDIISNTVNDLSNRSRLRSGF